MRFSVVSQQGDKAAGAEHALLQYLDALPRDTEVDWYFFQDGDFADQMRRRFASVTIISMAQHIAVVKRGDLNPWAILGSLLIVCKLSRVLKRRGSEFVLTNSMKAHILGSIAARIAGLPCINYVHDIVDGRARELLRFVSKYCATERFVCSSEVKQHLALRQTTVLHAAIDVHRFFDLPDKQSSRRLLGLPVGPYPVVAIVGRIAPWKGQDRFLRIVSQLSWSTAAHFCIVGSPLFGCDREFVDGLYEYINDVGLSERVTIVPWQEDLRVVYSAIDVACNCSNREPFGRTSLEALAAGVPIVCFDDAGICEVFEQDQGGIKVPALDEKAFGDAVAALLSDPDKYRRASVFAREAACRVDIAALFPIFYGVLTRVSDTARAKMSARHVISLRSGGVVSENRAEINVS